MYASSKNYGYVKGNLKKLVVFILLFKSNCGTLTN